MNVTTLHFNFFHRRYREITITLPDGREVKSKEDVIPQLFNHDENLQVTPDQWLLHEKARLLCGIIVQHPNHFVALTLQRGAWYFLDSLQQPTNKPLSREEFRAILLHPMVEAIALAPMCIPSELKERAQFSFDPEVRRNLCAEP